MKNYITYSKTKNGYILVVHAFPRLTGEFQWYLVDAPNETKETIL